jgi:hypothetical protein
MIKKIIAIAVGVIIVGGVSFYAGMKYLTSKNLTNSRAGFGNLSAGQQQRFQQMGGATQGTRAVGNRGINGGLNSGEILSKDNDSITIKLRDGGSKTVLFSTSTTIMKFSTGTLSDLVVGKNISANGTQNSDGSITAISLQLMPASSTFGF